MLVVDTNIPNPSDSFNKFLRDKISYYMECSDKVAHIIVIDIIDALFRTDVTCRSRMKLRSMTICRSEKTLEFHGEIEHNTSGLFSSQSFIISYMRHDLIDFPQN